MNTAEYVYECVIPSALALLPEKMHAFEAWAMLLAIGFQESGFAHRSQVSGPARGFWQFEEAGGVNGVLSHSATKPIITPLLDVLVVRPWDCYEALAQNDILACVFARLLLWTHPSPLPSRRDETAAWSYYLNLWRPGKPHPEVWGVNWSRAWAIVQSDKRSSP